MQLSERGGHATPVGLRLGWSTLEVGHHHQAVGEQSAREGKVGQWDRTRRRRLEPNMAWPYREALFVLAVVAMTICDHRGHTSDAPCAAGEVEIGSDTDRFGAEHRTCQGEDGFIDIDIDP